MDYFRAIIDKNELSQRALDLTEDVSRCLCLRLLYVSVACVGIPVRCTHHADPTLLESDGVATQFASVARMRSAIIVGLSTCSNMPAYVFACARVHARVQVHVQVCAHICAHGNARVHGRL